MQEIVNFDFRGKRSYVNVRYFGEKHCGDVLALHGLGTQGYSFDQLAKELSQNIIAIDWYGYGKSDRRLGDHDKYGAQTCADWLMAAVIALQSKGILTRSFSIIAMSMSAIPVALDFEKLLIKKLILIHPAGLDKKISRKLAFGLSSGFLTDNLLKIITLRPVWELIWLFTPIQSSDERRNYIRNDVINKTGEFEVLRRYSKSGFDYFGNMKKTHYIPEQFEKIKCPVLLLYGNDTTFYKKKYVEFGKKAGWKIINLKKAPHNLLRSHTELIANPINNFLSEKL